MYSYPNSEIFITNSLLRKFTGLKAEAAIYNLDGTLRFSKQITAEVEPDSIARCFALPAVDGLSPAWFLRLQLTDNTGAVQSINWYWLSQKGDVLDWKKSKWYMTPQTAYTDYSSLQNLPKTSLRLTVGAVTKMRDDSTSYAITVTNTGKTVAFQLHLRALKGRSGDDILPVIFSDNYLELAPGESRAIHCTYLDHDAAGATPFFLASAWNLDAAASTAPPNAAFTP
jgi:exo-1,4-beta-D-glucosaminidase